MTEVMFEKKYGSNFLIQLENIGYVNISDIEDLGELKKDLNSLGYKDVYIEKSFWDILYLKKGDEEK